jgi:hypothetical protein
MQMDFEVFIFKKKIHPLPFALRYEFKSVHVKRRYPDLFCKYYHIQCVCNYSAELVVLFHFVTFWHIQNFILNLDNKHLKSQNLGFF